MSGQGIHKTAVASELRQAAWNAIEKRAEFTAADVCEAVGASEAWGRKVVREWLAEGLLDTLRKDGMTYIYKARVASDPVPSAFSREREKPEFAMWRTMRDLRRFKAADVHMQANTETTPLTLERVQKYCTTLAEAGFLAVKVKGIAGKRPAVYAINGRPGPFPPREMRVPAIWDPNSEEFTILERRVRK